MVFSARPRGELVLGGPSMMGEPDRRQETVGAL